MEKKLTNSGPLREPADKHSIYTIKIDGKLHDHLTPLNDVQKRILALMEVPLESYYGLIT
jgi:hypothetical protein